MKGHPSMQNHVINNALKWTEVGLHGLHGPHVIRIVFNFEDDSVLIQPLNMEVGIVTVSYTHLTLPTKA